MIQLKKLCTFVLQVIFMISVIYIPVCATELNETEDISGDLLTSNAEEMTNLVLFVDFSDTKTHNHSASDEKGCFKKPGNAGRTFHIFDGTDISGNLVDKRGMKPYLSNISYGAFSVNNVFPQYDEGTKTMRSYVLSGTAEYYAKNPSVMLSEVMKMLSSDPTAKGKLGSVALCNRESGVIDNVMLVVGCATGGMDDPFGGVTYKSGDGACYTDNGKNYMVGSYNIITESESYLGVHGSGLPIHEFMHSIGYPDLYSKTMVDNKTPMPVGVWDIMSSESMYVQYPLAYMRQSVSGWLTLPTVTTNQTKYTLTAASATTQATKNNQAVILKTPYSDSEFFVVEYRKKMTGTYDYDSGIPGSGIIIYRVNTNVHSNILGAPFAVYVYRDGDTVASNGYEAADGDNILLENSYFPGESRRTIFGSGDSSKGLSDNAITYSDGTNSGIVISNIGSAGSDTITFDITFSNKSDSAYWTTVANGRTGESTKQLGSYLDTDGTLYTVQAPYDNPSQAPGLYSMKDGVWSYIAEASKYTGNSPVLTKYNNTLYMAYQNTSNKLCLARFDGTRWNNVYTSADTITEFDMDSDSSGITLVYNGGGYMGMYACHYNGAISTSVITPSSNGTWMANPKLRHVGDTPCVVYRNATNGNVLSVKKYINGTWKALAVNLASDNYTLEGQGTTLYLAASVNNHLEVYRTDIRNQSAGFINCSSQPVTDKAVTAISMNIRNSVPYIAYEASDQLKVAKLEGNGWTGVGNTVASVMVDDLSLYSDSDYLYTVYRDTNKLITCMRKYKETSSGNSPVTPPSDPVGPSPSVPPVVPDEPVVPSIPDVSNMTLSGKAHIQDYGDRSGTWNRNTLVMGTTGQAKRLEAVTINLQNNTGISGGVEYRVHRQDYGWTGWVTTGKQAGTTGQAKRLEAIQLRLTGELAKYYSIRYRVHIQNYGWNQGWQYDGSLAGTTGEALRLEAFEIQFVPRTESMGVTYRVHRQDYGWETTWCRNGATSGTTGQAKRLEGITLALTGNQYSGGIQYKTHVQNYGWMPYVDNGWMSGTSGKALRLEGIKIQLTGEVSNHYDVYYRVHAQDYGWLGWAKNGESAGTEGLSKRLEAIQIILVQKNGQAPASDYNGIRSATNRAFVKK